MNFALISIIKFNKNYDSMLSSCVLGKKKIYSETYKKHGEKQSTCPLWLLAGE